MQNKEKNRVWKVAGLLAERTELVVALLLLGLAALGVLVLR